MWKLASVRRQRPVECARSALKGLQAMSQRPLPPAPSTTAAGPAAVKASAAATSAAPTYYSSTRGAGAAAVTAREASEQLLLQQQRQHICGSPSTSHSLAHCSFPVLPILRQLRSPLPPTTPSTPVFRASSSSSIAASAASSPAVAAATLTSEAGAGAGGSAGKGSGAAGGLLEWYLSWLESHPVLTKSLTACGIFSTADVISQVFTHVLDGPPTKPAGSSSTADADAGIIQLQPHGSHAHGFHWDAYRTLRMAGVGLLLSGPTLHLWFGAMARWRPGTDLYSAVQKMLAGLVLYGPVFNTIFFSSNAALQGESSQEIGARLRRDLIPTLARGLMYWPFVDVLTFRYVPVHLQAARAAASSGSGPSAMPRDLAVGVRTLSSFSGLGPVSRGGSEALLARLLVPPVGRAGVVAGAAVASASIAQQYSGAISFGRAGVGREAYATAGSGVGGAAGGPVALSRGGGGGSEAIWQPGSASSGCGGSAMQPAHMLVGARTFVQLRTMLQVADNSGAKRVMCIKVVKGGKPNAAVIGDVIIASVKDAEPAGKVRKGEVVTCVVVRAAFASRRADGSMVRFDGPAAVVINKSGEPVGTRVFGPVPHELRSRNMVKLLALAQLVT